MENKEVERPEVTGHALPPVPRCELPAEAINVRQFDSMKNTRAINRKGNSLLVEATVRCTQLCNLFFKCVSNNPDQIELQTQELLRLDSLWKKWLRERTDKFIFIESAPFFLEKIHFMMGDSKTIQAEINKINSSILYFLNQTNKNINIICY